MKEAKIDFQATYRLDTLEICRESFSRARNRNANDECSQQWQSHEKDASNIHCDSNTKPIIEPICEVLPFVKLICRMDLINPLNLSGAGTTSNGGFDFPGVLTQELSFGHLEKSAITLTPQDLNLSHQEDDIHSPGPDASLDIVLDACGVMMPVRPETEHHMHSLNNILSVTPVPNFFRIHRDSWRMDNDSDGHPTADVQVVFDFESTSNSFHPRDRDIPLNSNHGYGFAQHHVRSNGHGHTASTLLIQDDPVLMFLLVLLGIMTIIFIDVMVFLLGNPKKVGTYPVLCGAVRKICIVSWTFTILYVSAGTHCYGKMFFGVLEAVEFVISLVKTCTLRTWEFLCSLPCEFIIRLQMTVDSFRSIANDGSRYLITRLYMMIPTKLGSILGIRPLQKNVDGSSYCAVMTPDVPSEENSCQPSSAIITCERVIPVDLAVVHPDCVPMSTPEVTKRDAQCPPEPRSESYEIPSSEGSTQSYPKRALIFTSPDGYEDENDQAPHFGQEEPRLVTPIDFNEMEMSGEGLKRSVSSCENGPDVSKQNMRDAQLAIYERNLSSFDSEPESQLNVKDGDSSDSNLNNFTDDGLPGETFENDGPIEVDCKIDTEQNELIEQTDDFVVDCDLEMGKDVNDIQPLTPDSYEYGHLHENTGEDLNRSNTSPSQTADCDEIVFPAEDADMQDDEVVSATHHDLDSECKCNADAPYRVESGNAIRICDEEDLVCWNKSSIETKGGTMLISNDSSEHDESEKRSHEEKACTGNESFVDETSGDDYSHDDSHQGNVTIERHELVVCDVSDSHDEFLRADTHPALSNDERSDEKSGDLGTIETNGMQHDNFCNLARNEALGSTSATSKPDCSNFDPSDCNSISPNALFIADGDFSQTNTTSLDTIVSVVKNRSESFHEHHNSVKLCEAIKLSECDQSSSSRLGNDDPVCTISEEIDSNSYHSHGSHHKMKVTLDGNDSANERFADGDSSSPNSSHCNSNGVVVNGRCWNLYNDDNSEKMCDSFESMECDQSSPGRGGNMLGCDETVVTPREEIESNSYQVSTSESNSFAEVPSKTHIRNLFESSDFVKRRNGKIKGLVKLRDDTKNNPSARSDSYNRVESPKSLLENTRNKTPSAKFQSVRHELFAKLKTRPNYVDQEKTQPSISGSPQKIGQPLSPCSKLEATWSERKLVPKKLKAPGLFLQQQKAPSPNLLKPPPRAKASNKTFSQLMAKWSTDDKNLVSSSSVSKLHGKDNKPLADKDDMQGTVKMKKIMPIKSNSHELGKKVVESNNEDAPLSFLNDMLS